MTTPSDVSLTDLGSAGTDAGTGAATRPFTWSVRRELWENRSVWIAPLAVAAVALLGFAISTIGLAGRRAEAVLLDEAGQRALIGAPYDIVSIMLIVTGLIVAVFYCIDALHGERRDRSILFWKSLPVSDRTAVLAKASIPMLVLPSIVFAITIVLQTLMALLTGVILLAHGMSPTSTFAGWNPLEQPLILLYGLVVLVLWHAPLYAWFLLVSAWARRAIVLWAVVPLIAFSALFRVAWSSEEVCSMVVYRAIGGVREAFVFTRGNAVHSLSQLNPGVFFTRPGLWIGLALAAAFLAAAVSVRRYREPI